jgi:hypothetical protein
VRSSPRKTGTKPRNARSTSKTPTSKSAAVKEPTLAKTAPIAPKANAALPPLVVANALEQEAQMKSRTTSKKLKTVRDSFNMPVDDYALIAQLKKRALALEMVAKKSELLRAGLRLLARQGPDEFKSALATVPAIKTGRPGKRHGQ